MLSLSLSRCPAGNLPQPSLASTAPSTLYRGCQVSNRSKSLPSFPLPLPFAPHQRKADQSKPYPTLPSATLPEEPLRGRPQTLPQQLRRTGHGVHDDDDALPCPGSMPCGCEANHSLRNRNPCCCWASFRPQSAPNRAATRSLGAAARGGKADGGERGRPAFDDAGR